MGTLESLRYLHATLRHWRGLPFPKARLPPPSTVPATAWILASRALAVATLLRVLGVHLLLVIKGEVRALTVSRREVMREFEGSWGRSEPVPLPARSAPPSLSGQESELALGVHLGHGDARLEVDGASHSLPRSFSSQKDSRPRGRVEKPPVGGRSFRRMEGRR